MRMKEEIESICVKAKEEIAQVTDAKALNEVRVKYLGKKGELTAVLRGMGTLPAEERPIIGSLVNVVRDELETLITKKEDEFANAELEEKLRKETLDITLPATKVKRGSKHPMNRIIEEVDR